ncbi:MAG TPA: hypothetical protein VNL36_02035 [Bacteroidota bacterium]|nr:hypothetical protein [Bacteroidota bacterium]
MSESQASVSLESLLQTISALSPKEKLKLFEVLHEQLEQAEESFYEKDPDIKAQIHEARVAYRAKDYVTAEEYISGKRS